MLCVKLFKGANLIAVISVGHVLYYCVRNALLAGTLASISSTWSDRSTLQRDLHVRHWSIAGTTRVPSRRQLSLECDVSGTRGYEMLMFVAGLVRIVVG